MATALTVKSSKACLARIRRCAELDPTERPFAAASFEQEASFLVAEAENMFIIPALIVYRVEFVCRFAMRYALASVHVDFTCQALRTCATTRLQGEKSGKHKQPGQMQSYFTPYFSASLYLESTPMRSLNSSNPINGILARSVVSSLRIVS